MADHETTIKLKIEGDDNDLKIIADKIDEVMSENPYNVDLQVDSETDKALDDLDEINSTNIESKQIEIDSNANETIDELEQINLIDFTYLGNSFQEAAERMAAEAEVAAERIELSMNIPNFEGLVQQFQSVEEAAKGAGDAAEEASNKFSQTSENVSESSNILSSAVQGIVALGLADTMLNFANSAGDANSQFNRLSITLDNIGVGAGKLDQYKSMISNVADTTGRSAGTIREFFISMSNQGIKSGELIGNTFKGIASAAYMMNTDIDSASGLFTRMITSGAIMSRSLAQAGISMDDFAKVMGVQTSEVSKAFKNMSTEQRASIMEMVLNNKYGSDANEGFKNSWQGLQTQLEKALGGLQRFLGELLLPVFIPATKTATEVINTLTDGLKGLPDPLKNILGGAVAAAGGLAVLSLGAKSFSGFLGTFKDGFGILTKLFGLGGKTPNMPGGGKEGNGGFLKWITNMNKFAAEAAASTGPSALSWTTLSAGIQAMLAPMLMVSAVIMVMIPVITVIVAEILIFARLIGELIKALRFDKLNLGPSIDGIKQIAIALGMLTLAFTGMIAVNLANIVYTVTGGLLGTVFALGQFWLAAQAIALVLKDLQTLKIDKSVVEKVNQIKDVLTGVSNAMNSMSALNLSGFGVMLTGGMLAVRQNIRHLTDIGKEIQAINIPPISNDKIEMIKKLSESLQHIQKASDAVNESLGWFGEKMTTISDTNGVKTTLDNLYKIAIKINAVNLPKISNEKSETIKNLSSAIGDIQKASDSINESLGWFGEKMTTITDTKGLKTTLDNLYIIGTDINNVNLPNIAKDKIDSIRNLKNAILPLVDSSKAISDNYKSIITTHLMAEPFKLAIDTLYSINQKINEKPFEVNTNIVTAINNLKTVVKSVADTATDIVNIKDKIGDDFGEAVSKTKGAISSLYSINQHINSMPFKIDESKTKVINSLKNVIQTIVDSLNTATGVRAAAANMGTQIVDGFRSTIVQLKGVAAAEVGWAIHAIQSRYQTAYNAGYTLAQKLVTGFRNGLDQHSPGLIARSVIAEAEFMAGAITNALPELYNKGRELYMSAVSGFGGGINKGSPGDIANMMSDEMNYTLDAMKSSLNSLYQTAQNLGQNIVAGFGDIDLKINEILKNFTIDPIVVPLIFDTSNLQSNYDNAISEFRNELKTRYDNNIIDRDIYLDRNSNSGTNNQVIENHYHWHSFITEREAIDSLIDRVKSEQDRENSRQ